MKHLLMTITVCMLSFQTDSLQQSTTKRQSKSSISFPPPVLPYDPTPISVNNISKHEGEWVIVTGKVFGYKQQKNHLLLFLGLPYPRQLLTLKVNNEIINNVKLWKNKTIKATGKVLGSMGHNPNYQLGVNHTAYISKVN